MPTYQSVVWMLGDLTGWKYVLPDPLTIGIGILPRRAQTADAQTQSLGSCPAGAAASHPRDDHAIRLRYPLAAS